MKIKLVVFDMDGTLLDSQKRLPEGFFDAVEKLKKLNIKLMIASGRQYQSLYQSMGDHRDDFIYLSDNGALVFENNQCVYYNVMDDKTIHHVIDCLSQYPYGFFCSARTGGYVLKSTPPRYIKEFSQYVKTYTLIDSFDTVTDIVKLAIYDETKQFQQYKQLEELVKDKLYLMNSGPDWCDIMNLNISKGHSLDEYLKLNKLSKDEVMVFGDAMNDYEMMALVTHSFAMANADPRVKAVSRYETLSHDHNGVMVVLNKLIEHNGDFDEKTFDF